MGLHHCSSHISIISRQTSDLWYTLTDKLLFTQKKKKEKKNRPRCSLLLWAKFHWKIHFGKWFFKFSPKWKWRKAKIRNLETVNVFWFLIFDVFPSLFRILFVCLFLYCFVWIRFFLVYSVLVLFITQFRWESGFLRGVPWTLPRRHQRVGNSKWLG